MSVIFLEDAKYKSYTQIIVSQCYFPSDSALSQTTLYFDPALSRAALSLPKRCPVSFYVVSKSISSFLYSIDSALSGTGASQQIKQQTNMFSQKISGLGLFLLISFCENFTFRFQTHQNKIKTDLDPYFKK